MPFRVKTPDFSIRLPLKSAACLLWQVSHFVLTETAARLWGLWQVTHATLSGCLQRDVLPGRASPLSLNPSPWNKGILYQHPSRRVNQKRSPFALCRGCHAAFAYPQPTSRCSTFARGFLPQGWPSAILCSTYVREYKHRRMAIWHDSPFGTSGIGLFHSSMVA